MNTPSVDHYTPWNKGKLVGQKHPLRLRDVWAIRVRLQLINRTRDLSLFELAIDSKLKACDLVVVRVRDVSHVSKLSFRAIIIQKKTHRPVQFEVTEQTRSALNYWIQYENMGSDDFIFPSCHNQERHLSTRQHARL